MKSESCLGETNRVGMHDLTQPLNVIRLATGNIRIRILPQLGAAEADYLANKLKRIDLQIDRAAALLAQLCDPADSDSPNGA